MKVTGLKRLTRSQLSELILSNDRTYRESLESEIANYDRKINDYGSILVRSTANRDRLIVKCGNVYRLVSEYQELNWLKKVLGFSKFLAELNILINN